MIIIMIMMIERLLLLPKCEWILKNSKKWSFKCVCVQLIFVFLAHFWFISLLIFMCFFYSIVWNNRSSILLLLLLVIVNFFFSKFIISILDLIKLNSLLFSLFLFFHFVHSFMMKLVNEMAKNTTTDDLLWYINLNLDIFFFWFDLKL